MKFNICIILSTLFLLLSCDQAIISQGKKLDTTFGEKYRNSGFSLIYNDQLKIKKIDQRSLTIFHKNLKRKSSVKITNPLNGKSLIAEVKSNRVKFSPFYNSIITERIAEELELDLKEPYIKIILISKNSTYIAKKTKTFEEEKNVATKVPVEKIKIKDLSLIKVTDDKTKKITFNYSIFIADFYFKESANGMVSRIKEYTNIQNIKVNKITNNQYRVNIGPFKNLKSLKNSFNELKILNFENIEIIKN